MTRADLEQLERRLVEARGPDRELADAVLLACGWTKVRTGHFYGPIHAWCPPGNGRGYKEDNRPNPLSSADAALACVPDGWQPAIKPWFRDDPEGVSFKVMCIKADWKKFYSTAYGDDEFKHTEEIESAELPRGIAISAIRARLSMLDGEGV